MNSNVRKDLNSNRTKAWLSRNSLSYDLRVKYIFNLCETVFNFKEYNISKYFDIDNAFFISYGLRSYVAYIDEETACIKVLEKRANKNSYSDTNMYFGSNHPWYDFLSWVKNRI